MYSGSLAHPCLHKDFLARHSQSPAMLLRPIWSRAARALARTGSGGPAPGPGPPQGGPRRARPRGNAALGLRSARTPCACVRTSRIPSRGDGGAAFWGPSQAFRSRTRERGCRKPHDCRRVLLHLSPHSWP